MGNARRRSTSRSARPRLFDDFERTDAAPASWSTGSFEFLNRAATPYWAAVRALLDEWFADFATLAPPQKARDLRARFRSAKGQQHEGAFWEIYVFQLLRHLLPTSTVTVEEHPSVVARRPDFAVVEGSLVTLYVEAVAPLNDPTFGPSSALEATVLDTITSIENSELCVMLGPMTAGGTLPRRSEIVEPIVEWLDSLELDDVARALAEGRRPPTFPFRVRGWSVEMTAIPRARTDPGPYRLIAAGPVYGGMVRDVEIVRRALTEKAGRYEAIDAPLAIAVRCPTPWRGDDQSAEVLLGSGAAAWPPSRDGLWSTRRDVSAVIFGHAIGYSAIATAWPELWLNPDCVRPLEEVPGTIPVVCLGPDGVERRAPRVASPGELFGLEPGWPGPDPWSI